MENVLAKLNQKQYRTICISDFHLGTRDCKAQHLLHFLKSHSCENLYLVGDIIDGWRIQQNKWRWKKSHSEVVRKILSHAKKGTKVVYIPGNHDEFLRPLISFGISFAGLKIVNQVEHIGVDGKRYLITHGDLFDNITRLAPWISILGDKAYDFVLVLNTYFNWIRKKLGFNYWSISKYLKSRVKKAADFLFKFENTLTGYCVKKGYAAVICGHIHSPDIKKIDNIWYFNTGDFVESISAVVETHGGDWILLHLFNNRWEPIKILDKITQTVIVGPACFAWFATHNLPIISYSEPKAKSKTNEKNISNFR